MIFSPLLQFPSLLIKQPFTPVYPSLHTLSTSVMLNTIILSLTT